MRYLAELALLADRVEERVLIEIDPAGVITQVEPRSTADAERLAGFVVAGMPNLHSHAFQRAMAGMAERAGPDGDSFWRWRETMYRFLAVLTPDDVEAIAAQLYVECLLHGYTSVAEFHYLHNAPDGTRYSERTELAQRIVAAAQHAGIGLTLLPVLYRHAGFGGAPPLDAQRRFVLSLDDYAGLCETMASQVAIGIAPHSLRAVTQEELGFACQLAGNRPIHIHAAEQEKEVADCLAWSGERPVAWLLDHADVDNRWCLVHATHLDAAECRRLAASDAVAGLCQTTEANLGDGSFPLHAYLSNGGRFGIGSDSHVSTSPVEELRWLDYVRRLETRSRNALVTPPGGSIGLNLYQRAVAGGAQALGRNAGVIAPGRLADLVVLDRDHPALLGRSGAGLLDAWLYCGNSTPVRDVMVGGVWVVRDGQHRAQRAIAAAFARTMRRLEITAPP
ncbi:MAG TPA: formimidoylglutamate deiminase [Acetobacteraceae bacterium]|nr:formimidoylglutamate deiminase [Acetobacteraceae bacterium]